MQMKMWPAVAVGRTGGGGGSALRVPATDDDGPKSTLTASEGADVDAETAPRSTLTVPLSAVVAGVGGGSVAAAPDSPLSPDSRRRWCRCHTSRRCRLGWLTWRCRASRCARLTCSAGLGRCGGLSGRGVGVGAGIGVAVCGLGTARCGCKTKIAIAGISSIGCGAIARLGSGGGGVGSSGKIKGYRITVGIAVYG